MLGLGHETIAIPCIVKSYGSRLSGKGITYSRKSELPYWVVDKSSLFSFFLTILESRTINNQDWHLSQAKACIYLSFIIGQ